MTIRAFAASPLLAALIVSSSLVLAQAPAAPSGHWEGAIQAPGQEIRVEIDLASTAGKWEGTVSVPSQGLKSLPLSAIAIQGDAVSFTLNGIPGTPQFKGTLSKDAKSLSGDFTQGGGTIPFAVTRTGDAKIERPPASTPITKDLEGTWEGPLDVNGTVLRLVIKLSNDPGGAATGSLISLDQGGAEVALAGIVQTGSHLKLMIPAVSGTYEADLKDGQLTGTWSQGPGHLPLTLKRQAPAQ